MFLVESTPILTRTAGELRTFLEFSPIDVDPSAIQYDVELHRVKYRTTYKGDEIIASGLAAVPRTTDPIGMISFHHGTIVAHEDAPSVQPINSPNLILYAALASAGFIAVIPDYIGFGESDDLLHPYYVEEVTASSVLDNLSAAAELANDKDLNFNSRLFLAGYSQGGYVTMAAHKAIETTGLEGFDLIASFPAAGGYDVKGVQEYFFAQDTYEDPFYLAYVALSYQTYYDWDNALSTFFQEPYAAAIPDLFGGVNTAGTINNALTTSIADLIQTDFRANIDTGEEYAFIVDAFNENSLLDWTPTRKMFMYHGDADVTVPYQNSVDTYNHFIAAGASPDVVTFTTLPGEDHGSGIGPYVADFVPKLLELR